MAESSIVWWVELILFFTYFEILEEYSGQERSPFSCHIFASFSMKNREETSAILSSNHRIFCVTDFPIIR